MVPKAIFAEKKAKMYFIEGRFSSKVAVTFVSVLLAYNAPSICPRPNASATAYSAPNRAGQTGQGQARRIERVIP